RVSCLHQCVDHAFAVGGALSERDFTPASGEPFDLLQLDPIPWWIAHNGIEPANKSICFPAGPNAGEGDLPVQEPLLLDQFPRVTQDAPELLGVASGLQLLAMEDDADGIAKLAIEEILDEGEIVASAKAQPVQCVDE